MSDLIRFQEQDHNRRQEDEDAKKDSDSHPQRREEKFDIIETEEKILVEPLDGQIDQDGVD